MSILYIMFDSRNYKEWDEWQWGEYGKEMCVVKENIYKN